MDWGLGRYEDTAQQLEPASAHVVELARLVPGERVLDLGCGTGNAALLAARAGAATIGLDPSARLIGVARERAATERADPEFLVGQAESLPFDDAAFDVVVSVFGVIFSTEPERAISEMLRVLRPRGRALVSAWLPTGPIATLMDVFGRAMAAVIGPAPPRFAWHEPHAVAQVARPHGASVHAYEGEIQFSGGSPEGYFETQAQSHPVSVASRRLLEDAGLYDEVTREATAVLRDGNEDPTAFRVTSPYRVLELRRQ